MSAPLFEMRGIRKAFPGVVALDDVSFACSAGEVHALCGENGAGKSTLMKILSGAYRPDAGEIRVAGEPVRFEHPIEAKRRGVSVIYQEFNLLPDRTVAENVFLGHEPSRFGLLDRRRMNAQARRLLGQLGAASVPPDELVRHLPIAQQQLVEIAKALAGDVKILVMDEPTAALNDQETASLFALVRSLKERGVAIVYITHRMHEIERLADTVTVLKDGRHVATMPRAKAAPAEIVRLMVGRELKDYYPPRAAPGEIGRPVLEVRNAGNRALRDITFALRAGEIVGIAGLEGSGKTLLARALFGVEPFTRGEVRLNGREASFSSPRQAIRLGLGFLSDNRKEEGLVLQQSVRDNCLLTVRALAALLAAPRRSGRGARPVDELAAAVDVRAASLDGEIRSLSGGNQQKAIIARWLAVGPDALVFAEPTRGIDVNARASIYHLMRELARGGKAILVVSSDLPEVIGVSDRILVMHAGRIAGELRAGSGEEEVMALATGHEGGLAEAAA